MTIPLPMRFEAEPLLWTVDGIYTPAECESFVRMIERAAPTLATNNALYRNQDRVMKDDPATSADSVRPTAASSSSPDRPLQIGWPNERLRFYRYSKVRNSPHTWTTGTGRPRPDYTSYGPRLFSTTTLTAARPSSWSSSTT